MKYGTQEYWENEVKVHNESIKTGKYNGQELNKSELTAASVLLKMAKDNLKAIRNKDKPPVYSCGGIKFGCRTIDKFLKYPLYSQEDKGINSIVIQVFENEFGAGSWVATEAEYNKDTKDWLFFWVR